MELPSRVRAVRLQPSWLPRSRCLGRSQLVTKRQRRIKPRTQKTKNSFPCSIAGFEICVWRAARRDLEKIRSYLTAEAADRTVADRFVVQLLDPCVFSFLL